MAITLYKRDGSPVAVDEAQAPQLIASGQLGVNPGGQYSVVGRDGKVGQVEGGNLLRVLSAGYQLATPEQAAEKEFGDRNVAAFGAGLARGVSFGLSDLVMTRLGLTDKRTLEGLRDANPVLSTGGEIAGTIGALLTPEGAFGGAAKVVGAAPRAVASLGAMAGQKAEGFLLKLLTRTGGAGITQMLGTAAGKAGALAAAGAVEGSLYGLGQGITEYALGDPKPVGEAVFGLLGNAATGALVGGVATPVLGGALELSTKTLGKLTENAVEGIGKLSEWAGAAARKDVWDGIGVKPSAVQRIANMRGKQEPWVDQVIDLLRLRGMTKDGGAIIRGGASERTANIGRLKSVVEGEGELLGNFRGQLDKLGVAQPNPDAIRKSVLEYLVEQRQTARVRSQRAVYSEVEEFLETQLPEGERWSFAEAFDAQQQLASEAFSPNSQGGIGVSIKYRRKVLQDVSRILKSEIETKAEAGILQHLGPDALERYKWANTFYWGLADLASKSRFVELREVGNGIWKQAAGYAARGMGMSIVGGAALPRVLLGGVKRAAVYGGVGEGMRAALEMQTQADVAAKLRVIQQAMQAAGKKVDAAVDRFVGRGTRGAVRLVPPMSTGILQKVTGEPNRKDAAKKYSGQLSAMLANPTQVADQIAAAQAGLEGVAPELAASMAGAHARAIMFLDAKAPKAPPTLQPFVDSWEPTDTQIARFERYTSAALNPYSVVEDVGAGIPSSEGIETLRTVYPELYQLVATQFLEQVAQHDKPLGHTQRLALSMLIGKPLDQTLQPDFVARSQLSYQAAEQSVKIPGTSGKTKTDSISNNLAPQSQQVQNSLAKA